MAPRIFPRFFAVIAVASLLAGGVAEAQSANSSDPPGRVGRLSFIEGEVQQRNADNPDWTAAGLNYPVTSGFAVATQEGGRAEIQVGSLALRLGSSSEVDVNNLGDDSVTLTLAQGEVNLRLGHMDAGVKIEVVTPRGAIDILRAGDYHLDAGSTETPTRIAVFRGAAQVERDSGPLDVPEGQAALINGEEGTNLQLAQAAPDPLDDWATARDQRDRRPATVVTAAPAPVSAEMTGAADLDAYGRWSDEPSYGAIWYPSAVPVGWVPYHYGHWVWVSPWGWTWVDDQPWGFAPFHYGRWIYGRWGWGWVPGVFAPRPVYAPALVAFIGSPGVGISIGVGIGAVGWFPLAPREVFVPAYPVSVNYVRNVNVTNVNITNVNITKVNNTIVVNNNQNTTVNSFANHRFATVVPSNAFASGRPVHQAAVQASPQLLNTAATLPVSHAPPTVAAHPIAAAALPHRDNAAVSGNAGTPGTAGNAGQNNGLGQNRSRTAHFFPTLPSAGSGTAAGQNGKGGNSAGVTSGTTGAVAPRAAGANPASVGAAAGNSGTASQPSPNLRGKHTLPPLPGSNGTAIVNRTPVAPLGASGGPSSGSRVQSLTIKPGQTGTPTDSNNSRANRVVAPATQKALPPLPGHSNDAGANAGSSNGHPAKAVGVGPRNAIPTTVGKPAPTSKPTPPQNNQKNVDKHESFNTPAAPPTVLRGSRQGGGPVQPAAVAPAQPRHFDTPHGQNPAPQAHISTQTPQQHVAMPTPQQHLANGQNVPRPAPQVPHGGNNPKDKNNEAPH